MIEYFKTNPRYPNVAGLRKVSLSAEQQKSHMCTVEIYWVCSPVSIHTTQNLGLGQCPVDNTPHYYENRLQQGLNSRQGAVADLTIRSLIMALARIIVLAGQ